MVEKSTIKISEPAVITTLFFISCKNLPRCHASA